MSGSGRRRSNPAGSVHSGHPLCVPGTFDIARWHGHTLRAHWSPRCHCSRISRTVGLPQIVPVGHHSNHPHTSDSASLHKGKGERDERELDGWLSRDSVGGQPHLASVSVITTLKTNAGSVWMSGCIAEWQSTANEGCFRRHESLQHL